MPIKRHISIDICCLIGIYMRNTLNNTVKCLINGINMKWILILTIFQILILSININAENIQR